MRSVLVLRAFDQAGSPIGLGSGFVVHGPQIVTNHHVVAGAAWVEVTDSEGTPLGSVRTALAMEPSLDLAILPLPSGDVPGLELAESSAALGEPIWVIGAPRGLSGTISNGIVSAIREIKTLRVLQITAPISPGSSGGPVLNNSGEVIGVAFAALESGQNLNFAIDVSEVRRVASTQLSESPFVAPPPPPKVRATFRDEVDRFIRSPQFRSALSAAKQLPNAQVQRGLLSTDRPAFYWFTGAAEGWMTLEVRSDHFDPKVTVICTAPPRSFEDDNGGDGWDATVLISGAGARPCLVTVRSAREGDRGPFEISRRYGVHLPSPGGSGLGANPESNRWTWALRDPDGATHFVDRHDLSLVEGNVRTWVRSEFPQPRSVGITWFDRLMSLYDFDCDGLRSRILYWNYFLHGESGDFGRAENWEAAWSPALPNSSNAALLNTACALGGEAGGG